MPTKKPTAPKVTPRKITDYQPDPANPNAHSERGVGVLGDSIATVGLGRSIVVDKNGIVLAGNSTQERAVDQGFEDAIEVESDGTKLIVVRRNDLDLLNDDDNRARKLSYYDNRAAELGIQWDAERLLADINAGVDLSHLFSEGELDELLAELQVDAPAGEDPGASIDRAEELQAKWQVKRGDLWIIGEHRLLCGDSTNAEDVARVMAGEKASAMINDAPYGMRLDADFSGAKTNLKFAAEKGAFGGKRYDNVIGDHEDYDARPILKILDYIKEQFWFGADYYSNTLPDTMHEGCWLVWDKRLDESADLMYGSCFELIWSKTRHKRDVLRHKWAGIFGVEQEQEKKRFHPTQKPTALIVDIINRYVDDGAIVIDCYTGSGTTLVACEQTGRKGRGIEIEPKYCAVILERMSGLGLTPRLSE